MRSACGIRGAVASDAVGALRSAVKCLRSEQTGVAEAAVYGAATVGCCLNPPPHFGLEFIDSLTDQRGFLVFQWSPLKTTAGKNSLGDVKNVPADCLLSIDTAWIFVC